MYAGINYYLLLEGDDDVSDIEDGDTEGDSDMSDIVEDEDKADTEGDGDMSDIVEDEDKADTEGDGDMSDIEYAWLRQLRMLTYNKKLMVTCLT